MAFYFTEEQVIQAAKRAYAEHAAMHRELLAQWRQEGPISVSQWTDPDTELDQLGEQLKDALASVRPTRPVLTLVKV